MNAKTPSYHGYRFPPEIISHAVWLYYRFCLSFRDVEDLLAERGVIASSPAGSIPPPPPAVLAFIAIVCLSAPQLDSTFVTAQEEKHHETR